MTCRSTYTFERKLLLLKISRLPRKVACFPALAHRVTFSSCSQHVPFIPRIAFFLRATERNFSSPTTMIYPMRHDSFRTRGYTHKWKENKIHLCTLTHNTNVLSLPRCRLAYSDAWHAKKYPNSSGNKTHDLRVEILRVCLWWYSPHVWD